MNKQLKDFIFNKKFNIFKIADFIVIFIIILSFSLLYSKEAYSKKSILQAQRLIIEISIPNLDPDIASQIEVSDHIVDKNGKSIFEIIEKLEKPSEHPVIDNKGNIVVSKHPQFVSVFLKLRTIIPQKYDNGIKYNWQVIKIGGSLIWETKYERFVGLVRKIYEEDK